MEEKLFFNEGDVKVTNTRFIVGSQTFAMSSVNSVCVATKDITRPSGVFAFLGVVGILVSLSSIGGLINGEFGYFLLLFPAAAMSVFFLYKLNNIKKVYEYSIVLTTSSGETAALASRDKIHIEKIEKALIDSIVHRG